MRFGASPVLARWTGRPEGDLGPVRAECQSELGARENGPDPRSVRSPGPASAAVAPQADHLGRPPGPADELEERRRALVDRSWSWVTQVHGAGVVVVDRPGEGGGARGDALVSDHPESCLAVFTADCAPIALASPEGVLGAVHAGWRGLLAGVVESAALAMRDLGATRIEAALGPCIHAECYEFSSEDLDRAADRFGPTVRGVTAEGRPALDLPETVRVSLRAVDVELIADEDICTACSPAHFSYRARGERQRMALVVWRA